MVRAIAGGQGRVRTGRIVGPTGTPGVLIGQMIGDSRWNGVLGNVAPNPIVLVGNVSGAGAWAGAMTNGAPAFSAETTQFFDRLITIPSSSRQTVYATLIDSLVSAGVWAKLDVLCTYAAADQATSLTNLVQAAHGGFLDTTTGVPTFTVDRGWSACGVAGQWDVNANFNPSTAGGLYTQNDAMFCAWQVGTTQENHLFLADTISDSKVELYPRWSDGNTYWAVNGTEITTTAPADGSGFWLGQRTASNASEIRRNDISIGTSATASSALTNSSIVLCPVANKVACMGIGASLSSAQQTAFYNALSTYLTAVGAI